MTDLIRKEGYEYGSAKYKSMIEAATSWVIDAVTHAHLSTKIKDAEVRLNRMVADTEPCRL